MPQSGFFFARHGETRANAENRRSGGDDDSPLTDRGRWQSRRLAEQVMALDDPQPGLILTAPLTRTLTTVRLINGRLKLPVKIDGRLRERHMGSWNQACRRQTEPAMNRMPRPPDGESRLAFKRRVLRVLSSIIVLSDHWPLVISSRGVSRVLLECLDEHGTDGLPNASLLRIRVDSDSPLKLHATEQPLLRLK